MSPKEKAEELVTKYGNINVTTLGCGLENGNPCISQNLMLKKDAKQCAIIAANEAKKCTKHEKQMFENDRFSEDYWNLVEQEISKLWHNYQKKKLKS